jgi:uncharacterized protein
MADPVEPQPSAPEDLWSRVSSDGRGAVATLPHEVVVEENVWIPLSDGTRLAARVWLPRGAENAPVPGVLEYIPYRKRDLTRSRDAHLHGYLAGYGYGCVRVDIRGSGESDGVLLDEYLEVELSDGEEVLAWMAEQPWCDGRVGIIGKSWGGFNGLQLAARRPPELGAVVAVCASDDRYSDDVHYMGGCLLGDNLSWASLMLAYCSIPPDPEIVGDRWRELWMTRLEACEPWLATWLSHPRRDSYWKYGSVSEDYSAIECPVMAVSGWADGYTDAVFRLLEGLSVPRRGLVGPWGHEYPHTGVPGPPVGFCQEVVRWFDRWLKGIDNGVEYEPQLRVWLQDSVRPTPSEGYRPGRWAEEPYWPSPSVTGRSFDLVPGALVEPGTSSSRPDAHNDLMLQSPLTLGHYAGKWCSYTGMPDLPHDQREEDGGALFFDSDLLDEVVEILGAPVAELEIRSDKPVALMAARLSDVAPDGSATRVSFGVLNLTHRDSDEEPEPLEPEQSYRVRVQMNCVAHRFPPGHRMRLSLSTSYWPLAWLPPEQACVTVRPAGSTFTVPCRARDEGPPPVPFGPPEGGERPVVTTLAPSLHTWRVVRDLATDEDTLEVTNDDGRFRIEEIDLEVTRGTWEWYTTTGRDPTSARGETRTVRGFRRAGWDVTVETRSVLRCTADTFLLHAELDAYEAGTRIFSRNWAYEIPRDLV